MPVQPARFAPLFPRGTTSLLRVAAGLVSGVALGIPVFFIAWARTPYADGASIPLPQPVMFDHRHHTRDDGIDCRYCHAGVDHSPSAGVPTAEACMGCHGQIWPDAPLLAVVREAAATGRPVIWQRVSNVPDFVYFNHQAHVRQNVGCVTCHGRVDQMPAVYVPQSLSMQFCLDCHRAPENHVRPADRITDLEWQAGDQHALGLAIVAEKHLQPPTNCSGCHR